MALHEMRKQLSVGSCASSVDSKEKQVILRPHNNMNKGQHAYNKFLENGPPEDSTRMAKNQRPPFIKTSDKKQEKEKNAYNLQSVQRSYTSQRPTPQESRPTSTSSKENSIVNI